VRRAILLAVIAGTVFAQDRQPPIKFSTTVTGEPLYTFGTTVAASSGFKGDIYLLKPQTANLPKFSKLKPVGSIYTSYLCVPQRTFNEGFPGVTDRFEWFAIDYHARFWVSHEGVYRFALISDDGSKLYLDDKLAIDNDGVHPQQKAFGSVKLKVGVHRIRVSYFQGPRYSLALVLGVLGPDDKEFRVFDTNDFKPPADAPDWDVPGKTGGKK
jgi:hypothetical protein